MYYQSTLNVKYMYVSYGIYRWFKLIDCGELYGLNDSSTVKYMLKWLKNSIWSITWFIPAQHTLAHRFHNDAFAHLLFIRSSMICVNGWLWIGCALNACMTTTIERFNWSENFVVFTIVHLLAHKITSKSALTFTHTYTSDCCCSTCTHTECKLKSCTWNGRVLIMH